MIALVLMGGAGCEGRRASPAVPVLLYGVDGLDWAVMRPLLEAGRLPHVKALLERGRGGLLRTFGEHGGGTLSPVIWTSIATGKPPEYHGILGMLDREGHPYTSNARRGKALWNIADGFGLETYVSGWWITWPVEKIRGAMVSAATSQAQLAGVWKGAVLPDVKDQFHPASLEHDLAPIEKEAFESEASRTRMLERVFGRDTQSLPEKVREQLIHESLWSLLADEFYVRATLSLLRDHVPDLTMVYVGAPDVIGHRFFGYRDPSRFAYALPAAGHEGLAQALDRSYELMDEWLGELEQAMPRDARILLVSDHGMHAQFLATPDPTGKGRTGEHQDGPPGVLLIAGPGVDARPGDLAAPETLGTVLDVTPTVLAMLDLPEGEDMPGRVLAPLFMPGARLGGKSVPTHDTGFRPPSRTQVDPAIEAGFLRRYGELGYFGAPAKGVSAPKTQGR